MTILEPGERLRGPDECRCKECRCLFAYGLADLLAVPEPHRFLDGSVSGRLNCPHCGVEDTVLVSSPAAAVREFPREVA